MRKNDTIYATTDGERAIWRIRVGQFEKRLRKVRNNPKSVTLEELEYLLGHCGFEMLDNGKGSHRTYSHPNFDDTTVGVAGPRAGRKEVLKCYVVNVLEAIDKTLE